ncbi:hypothetical protein THZG08_820005 [Vibrio owensii]|nr:hypothetical protein THZG08_820005 [Vibrio owensii]
MVAVDQAFFYEDGLFPLNRGSASLLKSEVFVGIELKEVEVQ